MIGHILTATPTWVYVLLAYLTWIGLQRLKPATRNVRRLWITPAIFIAWGLSGLVTRHTEAAAIAFWIGGALVGGAIGGSVPQPLRADHTSGRVWQPGSVIPLVRNLFLFGSHYLLNVASSLQPQSRGGLMEIDLLVSGLGAGYFAGWVLRFVHTWRAAPDEDLVGSSATSAVAHF